MRMTAGLVNIYTIVVKFWTNCHPKVDVDQSSGKEKFSNSCSWLDFIICVWPDFENINVKNKNNMHMSNDQTIIRNIFLYLCCSLLDIRSKDGRTLGNPQCILFSPWLLQVDLNSAFTAAAYWLKCFTLNSSSFLSGLLTSSLPSSLRASTCRRSDTGNCPTATLSI